MEKINSLMRPRPRTRPPLPLPPLHPLQLRPLIDLHYAIYLAIRMRVVLPTILFLRVHVHRRNTQIPRFLLRKADLGASVFLAVDFDVGDPALLQPLESEGAEILIDWVGGAVVGVEVGLEIFSWGPEGVSVRESEWDGMCGMGSFREAL